jgi:hypothetical protein
MKLITREPTYLSLYGRIRSGTSKNQGSIPRKRKILFLHPIQTSSEAYPPSIQWVAGLFLLELNQTGRETHLSRPHDAEGTISRGYTSALPYVFVAWYLSN